MLLFLTAALTLAAAADRAGLAERAAGRIARLARGRTALVYLLVCLTTARCHRGAVARRRGRAHGPARARPRPPPAPLPPLLLGTVVVANAASVAVPQGNPTNLVVIERLDIGRRASSPTCSCPGWSARSPAPSRSAADWSGAPSPARTPARRRPGAARSPRPSGTCSSPGGGRARLLHGAARGHRSMVALHRGGARRPAAAPPPPPAPHAAARADGPAHRAARADRLRCNCPRHPGPATVAALLAVAVAVGLGAALTNNLPASVSVGSLLGAGPSAYAATIGLGIGALALPQGSVATLLAVDLAGPDAASLTMRRLAPVALTGLAAATLTLSLAL